MKANNLRFLISTALFLFLILPLHAEEENIRYYDIELVVFENLEENTDIDEVWPSGKQLQVPENAAILGRKFEGKLPPQYDTRYLFNTLSVNDYQLKEEVDSIKQAEQYRLLLHTGWRQPGLPKADAVTVYFKHAVAESEGGVQSSEEIASLQSAQPGDTPTAPAEPEANINLPVSVAQLDGLITIALSRYLHVDMELLYKKGSESSSVDMYDSSFLEDRRAMESMFYIKQNRRMRSKETHYIDHPKLGVLIRITPYEVIPQIAPVKVNKSTKATR